ncbi:GGDEF domain-containing response regulator [Planctobacterium marinum]|uniref:diguanylate cyclase n=1 Tax=Planctobacterium marinum TaxID=1631968 RepID=A0AA48KUH2_9ALTE|nr:hypothetical protein MACH26_41050 [Planctobacterium marinum]
MSNCSPDSQAKVLIIDDDSYFLEMASEALSDICDVETYRNPQKGLKRAMQDPAPDLIILDVIMPTMSGYQICRELKQNTKTFNIPVIFVSSLEQISEITRCFDLGAVDFIGKPVQMPLLLAKVKNHLMMKLQRDMLEELATKDPLTGLDNKRSYDQTLQNEWKRASRDKSPLSLVVCDIDFFKKYNDHYGHGQGDSCLKKVANSIYKTANRSADLVARIGGEEFAIILPNVDKQGAWRVANNVLVNLRNKQLPHAKSEIHKYVTLSVGVATVMPDYKESPELLFEAADAAMYDAKQNGRNRVIAHQESDE